MKARSINRDEATVPWYAARDARMRSAVEATHYTDMQKAKCEGMRFALEMVYGFKEIHITYRKKFVAIKVEHPIIRERKALRLLESDWGSNVVKIRTAQGIIYRVNFS
jgi:hypothetical protein